MRLDQALNRSRTPVQARFGTVTAVNPGICTVKVAGGEIPVIYLKGGAPSVGDFVRVHRQGVVSYLLNPSSGALWVGDSGLGGIWRVPTTGQNPVFYSIYGAEITAVAEGPDHNIYAVNPGSPNGYFWQMISSGPNIGNVSEIQLASASPTGICVGPDKNLWVSDSNGGVWKVVVAPPGTPFYDSTATFYPLPGSLPERICSGPNGDLWVADGSGPNPGMWSVTTAGQPTFYPIPNSVPTAIVEGPDGRLWLSDNTYGVVWAVTPTGAVESYPEPGAQNYDICVGPDKRLWQCDDLNGNLWATTTAGESTMYPLPGGSVNSPFAVAAGPDGRVWAANQTNPSTAAAMTTSGVGSLYALGSSSTPSSICSGP